MKNYLSIKKFQFTSSGGPWQGMAQLHKTPILEKLWLEFIRLELGKYLVKYILGPYLTLISQTRKFDVISWVYKEEHKGFAIQDFSSTSIKNVS